MPASDGPDRGELTVDAEAHGRAALLLAESLIHGLIARSVLPVAEAISIMEIALDAQIALEDDAIQTTDAMRKTTALLSRLVQSLKTDLPTIADDNEAGSEGSGVIT